jgi:hypothetical protein
MELLAQNRIGFFEQRVYTQDNKVPCKRTFRDFFYLKKYAKKSLLAKNCQCNAHINDGLVKQKTREEGVI